jgi:cell division protein FtsB
MNPAHGIAQSPQKIMARHRKKPSHGREIYYILCIAVALGLGLFSLFSRGGYLELRKARLELETRRNRVDTMKRENAERLKAIQNLKSNPKTQEKYIREKMGYGKNGEFIQHVPDDPAPAAPKK